MGKSAFNVRRADMFFFDPDDLVLVEDDTDPRYDPRVRLPVDEGLVANILYRGQGVLEPAIVAKDGDQAVVLDGRQRVKAAREANRRLVEQGVDPLRVPCVLRRGDDSDMFAVMVSANEHRATESPIEKARKVARYIHLGHTEEEAATLWGVSRMTIRNWLATLDLAPKVQKAIEAGRISPSAALPLGKLPREEQAARLDEMTAGDRKPTVRESRERAGGTEDRTKVRSRREIEGALGAVRKGGMPARVLAWVLGQSDDSEWMEG